MKLKHILLSILSILLIGCTSQLAFQGYGVWNADVKELGVVSSCNGKSCDKAQWPLSLKTPPEATTYHAALRREAAEKYGVSEHEIVLGEVSVEILAELDGTIRSRKATAIAGKIVKVP